MPREWETFYFMVGSSAAGLIGLLFVVITLTSDFDRSKVEAGSRVFLAPTIFHFAVVLLIGAVAAMPDVPASVVAFVVAAIALTGLAVGARSLWQMARGGVQIPHWSDYVFYGVLPAAAYLWLLAGGVALWSNVSIAPHAIGVGALALLLLGIRDAWDLATWLTYHRQG